MVPPPAFLGSSTMRELILSIAISCTFVCPALAQTAPADGTERTALALIAISKRWTMAEGRGDTGFVSRLLLPEYRSVDVHGVAHSKADILASTLRNASSNAWMSRVGAWNKHHPSERRVVIHDNTAVMRYHLNASPDAEGTASTDIFVYVDGRWRALYSQATDAADVQQRRRTRP